MTAIVIVEDDVLANEHLEFILQQAGYEVFSATSADEAAELLDDHEDVQLLVTDINLPRHRGWSETRCCGEGSTTRDEYHYHDGLQCAEGRRDSARELVPSKTLQRPKDDRGSTAFPIALRP